MSHSAAFASIRPAPTPSQEFRVRPLSQFLPSVLKKLKDKGFARGVSREDVRLGAEELGVPLDALIRDLLVALRPHEQALGLGGP